MLRPEDVDLPRRLGFEWVRAAAMAGWIVRWIVCDRFGPCAARTDSGYAPWRAHNKSGTVLNAPMPLDGEKVF